MSHSLNGDGVLRYEGRVCVPNIDDLRSRIIDKAHGSRYSINTGSTKMYHDLREVIWSDGLKRDVIEFVAKFPNYQQMKAEHQKLNGLVQEISIPNLMWEDVNMDFVVGLPQTIEKCDSIWVRLERMNKSAHFITVKYT